MYRTMSLKYHVRITKWTFKFWSVLIWRACWCQFCPVEIQSCQDWLGNDCSQCSQGVDSTLVWFSGRGSCSYWLVNFEVWTNFPEMRYIEGDDAFGFFENGAQSSFGSSGFKRFPLKLVQHLGHAGCFCVVIENEASCTSLNLFNGVLALLLVRIPNAVTVQQ